MVQQQFQLDPFTNTLFLFCGRRRDRIKALYWEGNGLVLLYKRLESGSFATPEAISHIMTQKFVMEGLSEATAEERYQERLKHAKPVLDAMLAWANSRTAAPKSALGKAFTYLKEQWPYLTNYLKDGRLELSNNRAERSINPFVIDRKNFLFANTPKGATGSAIMFSLIQTAIENNLDPYQYLTWLLKTANNADLEDEQTVQSLLPWNAPSEYKAK